MSDATAAASRTGLDVDIFPVLLYHEVAPTPGSAMAEFSTTPDVLIEHIAVLRDRGYALVTLSALADELDRPNPRRVAAITFDDGLRSFREHALDVLVEAGVPATMYVPTRWTGGSARWMGSDEPVMSVHELALLGQAGVEIGSHSHRHRQLDLLDEEQVTDELVVSKRVLEDVLGHRVSSFAYPHGFHDRQVRESVVRAGYENASAVKNAWSHRATDRYSIARLTIGPDQDPAWLADRLDRGAPLDPARELLRTRAFRAWRRLRSRSARTKASP